MCRKGKKGILLLAEKAYYHKSQYKGGDMHAENLTVTSEGIEAKGVSMTTAEFGMALLCVLGVVALLVLPSNHKKSCPAIQQ